MTNVDQCGSMQIKSRLLPMMIYGDLCSTDRHWSALIFIEKNWSLLIRNDREWSLLSHILDQFLKYDLYWSALIGIGDWSSMSWWCYWMMTVNEIIWAKSLWHARRGKCVNAGAFSLHIFLCVIIRQTTFFLNCLWETRLHHDIERAG